MNLIETLTVWLVSAAVVTAGSLAVANPLVQEVGPNLVLNGSFEDTSLISGSGWTTSGFAAEGFDFFIDTNPADAQSGTHSFAGGAIGAPGFISQNIATHSGPSYNIHLWLANPSGFAAGTEIQVLWGGSLVYSATDILGFGYREILIDPMATSALTTLSIGLRDDSFFLNVDNVSVRAVSPVPEPTTLLLLLSGLGVGAMLRRRRSMA
jgi:hypothetical protein